MYGIEKCQFQKRKVASIFFLFSGSLDTSIKGLDHFVFINPFKMLMLPTFSFVEINNLCSYNTVLDAEV